MGTETVPRPPSNHNCPHTSKTPRDWPQDSDQPDPHRPAARTHWLCPTVFLPHPTSIFSPLETLGHQSAVFQRPRHRNKPLSCFATVCLSASGFYQRYLDEPGLLGPCQQHCTQLCKTLPLKKPAKTMRELSVWFLTTACEFVIISRLKVEFVEE